MRSNIRFILSSNPQNLEVALNGSATATVEAEYGAVTVKGSVLTMAHHGVNAGNPAPCSYGNECGEGVEVVGLSHIDLDSLGGCAAILGAKPEAETFWKLAEFVDLNGAHKLQMGTDQIGATKQDVAMLYAFWAWSRGFRVSPNRDGSVSDVTDKVMEGCEILKKILSGDEQMIAAGVEFQKGEQKLNESSFVEGSCGVVIRVSPNFVNHLYADPHGKVHEVVVAFNTMNGSVTISFADAPTGDVNARTIVQKLWGDLAGGHAGIAGSPRDKRMQFIDIYSAWEQVVQMLGDIKMNHLNKMMTEDSAA